jgi:hypothetical protein
MKKIFTLLCCIALSAQHSFISAQATMKLWKGGEVVTTYKSAEVDSVTFATSEEASGNVYMIDNHKFFDLGLPSGILWAENNIGAETPTDDGDYFAWGETAPKDTYTSDNYFDPNFSTTVLDNDHDAAYVLWGKECHTPTSDEFMELLDNCDWTWTTENGVNGYKVTSKKNSSSIFFPASGCTCDGKFHDCGSAGYYWLSTLEPDNAQYAYQIYFYNLCPKRYSNDRTMGFTIRPVVVPEL